ncbi:MAG: hypothetical protein ABJJ37_18605 [Roseibium sp.]
MKLNLETLSNRRQVLAGGTALAIGLTVTASAIASTLKSGGARRPSSVFRVWDFPASDVHDVLLEAKVRRKHPKLLAQRLLKSGQQLTVQEEWAAKHSVPDYSSAPASNIYFKIPL